MELRDARPKSTISRLMVGAAARLNYEWALRRPGQPPFIVLTEFPRSGGNWVRDMLGDAMQIPVPRFSRFPVTFKSIIHNHDGRPTDHPTVYVIRDGRDVFESHKHKTVNTYLEGNHSLRKRILKLHPSLIRCGDHENIDLYSEIDFYKEWKKRPLGSRTDWGSHVSLFLSDIRDNTVVIRYEDLHLDAYSVINSAVEKITGNTADPEVIQFAVTRNSFLKQTGRNAGETVNSSTKRQGLVDAWKETMHPQIQEEFSLDFGEILTIAGYQI